MESADQPTAQGRFLDWPGVWNARDLGGLRARSGVTRTGALVRSSQLHRVRSAGWAAIADYGIGTIVDLRNPDQRVRKAQSVPDDLDLVEIPLEGGLEDDDEFAGWMQKGWLCTPLYYGRFIERWADRCADVARAIAAARPGGVLVQCSAGRDRTGLVTALVLTAVGVRAADVVDDYLLSWVRLRSAAADALGVDDDSEGAAEVVAREDTSLEAAFTRFVSTLDAASALRNGGLSPEHLIALRRRLVGDRPGPLAR